ncbi:hypothetical protein AMTR_s00003p00162280 [Amborella trichopoda]|uniref:Uncharacterized protein n=1 Tax=Amborella trichopoda TaxID=13333 RepID=W1P064_AMBTC|nr:hypothetical protein AMTR_s00003p00162280 [Amborella trichopoda]
MAAGNQLFRPDFTVSDHCYFEKRQLFLRSYQFCRKRGLAERIKGCLVRVKRAVWFKFRKARRFRRLVWLRFRYGFGRKRFHRLVTRQETNDWVSCW